MSPFVLSSATRRDLGNQVKKVIPLRSGDCYVLALAAHVLPIWLKVSSLAGIPVTPSLPNDVSTRQGVIYNVHPRHYSEIRDHILRDPVIRAVSTELLTNKYGRQTGAVKVTFASDTLPSEIKITDHFAYDVREFIRPPLRCFKCQKFGHGARTCKGGHRCASCAGSHYITSCTVKDFRCANCGGAHRAWSHTCIHFKEALVISSIMRSRGLRWHEAAKLHHQVAPTLALPDLSAPAEVPNSTPKFLRHSTPEALKGPATPEQVVSGPTPPKLHQTTHVESPPKSNRQVGWFQDEIRKILDPLPVNNKYLALTSLTEELSPPRAARDMPGSRNDSTPSPFGDRALLSPGPPISRSLRNGRAGWWRPPTNRRETAPG